MAPACVRTRSLATTWPSSTVSIGLIASAVASSDAPRLIRPLLRKFSNFATEKKIFVAEILRRAASTTSIALAPSSAASEAATTPKPIAIPTVRESIT